MTFDIKVDGRHKNHMCADGSITDDPGPDIYAGVISVRAVRLLMFLAQLNGMNVCAADVSQAFLYGDCLKKVYTRAGPEFGLELNGKYLLTKKGLYGLRSSAASYHIHLSNVLYKLGFVPSHVDSDLWIKDCDTHYEYIAKWVDDLLIASNNPKHIILEIEKTYELKGIGFSEYYLGGDISVGTVNNNKYIVTSAKKYVKSLIEKIERIMTWDLRK